MPAIRLLCEKFEAPAAPPHIYAGVSSILKLSIPIQFNGTNGSAGDENGEEPSLRRRAKNPTKKSTKIPALIVAVGLIVYTCLSGKSTSPVEYARRSKLGLDSLRGRFPPKDTVEVRAGQGEELEDDDDEISEDPAHVDAWLREIRDRRLTESDWFRNIRQGTGLGVSNGAENGEGEDHHEGDEVEKDEDEGFWRARTRLEDGVEEKDYLQAGLGTMVGAFLLLSHFPPPHKIMSTYHLSIPIRPPSTLLICKFPDARQTRLSKRRTTPRLPELEKRHAD